jgi:kinesin family protein C2/C3
MITSCLDGYNVCVFAYGQTGSGKTHTMEGNAEDPGVMYRAVGEIFKRRDEMVNDWKYNIFVCMLEIYNEQVNAAPLKAAPWPFSPLVSLLTR